MAVNLTNADSALKTAYLDVVTQQLNTKNPFYAAIKNTTEDVYGKEVRKLVIHGINGGIGAGTEEGALPKAAGANYKNFVTTLKNLYGVIEISDKAVRASESNAGAFVSLLNAEMQSLVDAGIYNFSRMLYGDGSGFLSYLTTHTDNVINVTDIENLLEGMIVEIRAETTDELLESNLRIVNVDEVAGTITVDRSNLNFEPGSRLCIQGSYMNEITGLGAIFNDSVEEIYGLKKSENTWLKPYSMSKGEITELDIQRAIDEIEKKGGKAPNIILCSWGVRRKLQSILSQNRHSVDMVELAGGYKAMTYNGIPIVADRFCPKGEMYLLNTEDFALHQLCDWQWLEGDDGKVLKQIPGKPVYTATLVKYVDMICSKPYAQGRINFISEV